MHVGQVERGQVLVVEGGPLAAVGVVRLERLGGGRVVHDGVHPGPDLLHDPEVGVELLLHQFVGRQLAGVLLALFEVIDPAGQVVVIGLDGRAARRDAREPFATGPRPAGLG